ncbi:hypothetical protein RHMOL_Rhmol10G0058500 [Rhododendron molle]|uniref:Uncharacterized protein n=1 Tax=Rhododendron molle TaxID=49168 RepID=A0ACC0LZ22_RHOML|nr:hypothetical protein RHMOL_Rhmol10G0058500 [Rhododendron molle]
MPFALHEHGNFLVSHITMVKAVVVLNSSEGVNGTVYFTQKGDGLTTVTGSLSGLKPGAHGFHVHALGDTTNGCMSTNFSILDYSYLRDRILILLAGKEHGAPEDEHPHAGDLGNVIVGEDGMFPFDNALFFIIKLFAPRMLLS